MTIVSTTRSIPTNDSHPAARRPPLTRHERLGAGIALLGLGAFAVHGSRTGASGTLQYLLVVSCLLAGITALRRRPLPPFLAVGLGVLAVAHLAGGLVTAGESVLYNATPGPEVLRYDHLVHSAGIFLGTFALWELLVRRSPAVPTGGTGALVVLGVLAGLGLGALNEAIEFVATLVQHGSHVGGYVNTGWDLVTNTVAGLAAGLTLDRRRRHSKEGLVE